MAKLVRIFRSRQGEPFSSRSPEPRLLFEGRRFDYRRDPEDGFLAVSDVNRNATLRVARRQVSDYLTDSLEGYHPCNGSRGQFIANIVLKDAIGIMLRPESPSLRLRETPRLDRPDGEGAGAR